ncbi:ParB/RepB/Spo0J family partition protein [Tenacibaculum maritimum]|nr:ParB/RepB/Spo0J family partition protein [Tenacibaculum maritimum]MDB0602327.1 ParB/RepB/Spo0J family partition protein [Tenacibaculum maritimum]MDB0612463.1 ParB/RepB/Spo0J family partition protein [Tenacibaculum maritimum]
METIIENKLQILELDKIFISKTNPRKTIDEKALNELSQSIKQKGVIQPILVRPIGDKFELVCGERRYRASLLAELNVIPTNIRELSDDEAFELQIIENLERKDVHPLDEADAFKNMLDSGKYAIEDVAAKMAKTESFIAGRLKLVDLIESIRTDFVKGFLGIGHATLIAKCDSFKQEEIYNDAKPWRDGDEPNYGTYQELKENIEDELLDLTTAPFSLISKTLVKGVGACSSCPKRSKANPILFDEFQDGDNCFDEKCFNSKTEAFTQKELAKIINENLDVCIVAGGKPSDFIIDMCKQFNVKILKHWDDYKNYDGPGYVEKKAFNVSGSEAGTYEKVFVKINSSNSNESSTADYGNETIKQDIEKIEARAKRALELDAEKVWSKILDVDNKVFKNSSEPLSNHEKRALVVAMHNHCYQLHNELEFVKNTTIETVLTEAIPDQLVNLAERCFIANTLNHSYGSHKTTIYAAAYKQVMEDYYSEDVKQIETEQKEIADKRIERINKRISDLQAKLSNKSGVIEFNEPVKVDYSKPEKTFEKVSKKYALNNSYFKNRKTDYPANPLEVLDYWMQHNELPFDMGDESNWMYEV